MVTDDMVRKGNVGGLDRWASVTTDGHERLVARFYEVPDYDIEESVSLFVRHLTERYPDKMFVVEYYDITPRRTDRYVFLKGDLVSKESVP